MYDFKKVQEVAWIAAVAAGTVLVQIFVTFDPEEITDYRSWAIALGAGMIRAAAGAILAFLTRPKS